MSDQIQDIVDRTLDEERLLLGSVLRNMEGFSECMEHVKVEDYFLDSRHKNIWSAVYDFENSADWIDPQRFPGWMEANNRWDKCGGKTYVLSLIDSVPHGESVRYYAQCVASRYRWREAWGSIESFQKELLQAISDPTIQVPEAVERFEQNVYSLLDSDKVSTAQTVGPLITDAISRLHDRADNPELHEKFKTGLPELDHMVWDFEPGSLVVVGADTSAGKTSFAMQIAEHIAMNGTAVAYYSIEMTKEKLMDRFIASRSNLPREKINHPRNMSDLDWAELEKVSAVCEGWPLYISHISPLDIYTLSSFTRRLASKADVKAIFVDYLQIMEYPDDRSEVNSIRILSRALKQLASNLGIAVVVLSQLRKRMAGQNVLPPTMDDLHSSSSLAKDADLVFMIHREETYHMDDDTWAEEHPEKVGTASILIRKQRNGPRGKALLRWNGARTRFESLQHVDPEWTE